MMRNEAYAGTLWQNRWQGQKVLRKPGQKPKAEPRERPKSEQIPVPVPAIIPRELFDALHKRLEDNLRLARRNAKREYLLSGLVNHACGSGMGGRANHGKTYYHCFKSNHFKAPINDKGEPNPCACKWISARALEAAVWDTVTDLLQQPELLVRELEKLTQPDSASRQALEEELAQVSRRLEKLPKEERRLVEGYRKGFYSDVIMRDEMGQVQQEQAAVQERMRELQRQLAHMDRALNYQGQVEDLTVRLRQGLDSMGFSERRELLRLLVEQVVYEDGQVTTRTILPLEQLHPIPQWLRGTGPTHPHRGVL